MRRFGSFVLAEAINYNDMFKKLFSIELPESLPYTKEEVFQAIAAARRDLKKEDRIVWFLRLMRFALIEAAVVALAVEVGRVPQDKMTEHREKYQDLINMYSDEEKRWQKEIGGSPIEIPVRSHEPGRILRRMEYTKTRLLHFLSLPIPEIQTHVFGQEGEDELLRKFERAEAKWKEERKGTMPITDEEEILIDFKDGFYWLNLQKPYCEEEGKAMGHCGNAAAWERDDSVLSLRRKVNVGKEEMWYPHATFIRNGDGYLGEMKGRGNQKPSEKYHKYIISLFTVKDGGEYLIKGIRGGGYAPENNFSVSDLSPELQEELFATRPDLMPLYYRYKRDGLTDELKEDALKEYKEVTGVSRSSMAYFRGDYVVIHTYKDAKDYIDDCGNEVAKYIYKYLNGDGDRYSDYYVSDRDAKDFAADNDIELDEDSDDYEENIDHIRWAVQDGYAIGAESDMLDALIREMERPEQNEDCPYKGNFRIQYENLDSPIALYVSVEDFFKNILEDMNLHEWFGANYIYEIPLIDVREPHNGWEGFDNEAALEYLKRNTNLLDK